VLGSLELVRKRVTDRQVLRLLDNAIAGAQRGASLTQRMLAFARRQELKPEAVDVVALVRGMDDLFRLSTGSSVTVETSFSNPVDPVLADANQLEMALLNLVVNARDAMPDGGTVTIDARPEYVSATPGEKLKPGSYVRLSVTDTGVGMDPATLARATDPFFTTKGPGKGSGLGLSVVHGVMEQLGGRLVLRSRPGEGTTAELWLPVADERIRAVVVEPSQAAVDSKRRLNIVVVDDDAIVLLNTAAMLEDLGHRVLAAGSGQEALDILHRERGIDLVITDELMPRMTGSQLAKGIKQEWPKLPILLATGYAELPDGSGASLPRLAKPFWQADLARAIGDILPGRAKNVSVVPFRKENGGR
jgi:CheY-like chemotaxis protein/anti-sigma regulatory factor (Ser/Thr protein kinase)